MEVPCNYNNLQKELSRLEILENERNRIERWIDASYNIEKLESQIKMNWLKRYIAKKNRTNTLEDFINNNFYSCNAKDECSICFDENTYLFTKCCNQRFCHICIKSHYQNKDKVKGNCPFCRKLI